MPIYSIYKVTNAVNSKVYIGYTERSVSTRWKEHQYAASKNSHNFIHQAIRKHGIENFICEIIYQSKDKDHTLTIMEPYFICEYNSDGSGGYNLLSGGQPPPMSGKTHTSEAKAKMSFAKAGRSLSKEHRIKIGIALAGIPLKSEHKQNISAANLGRRHSSETKTKMSISCMGRTPPNKGVPMSDKSKLKISQAKTGIPLSPEHKEKLSAIRSRDWIVTYPDGSTEVITSMNKFCIANNLNGAKMTEVSQGKRRHHKNYTCIMVMPSSTSLAT